MTCSTPGNFSSISSIDRFHHLSPLWSTAAEDELRDAALAAVVASGEDGEGGVGAVVVVVELSLASLVVVESGCSSAPSRNLDSRVHGC